MDRFTPLGWRDYDDDVLVPVNCYNAIAIKRVDQGDIDEAIRNLECALEMCPVHYISLYNLACCYSLKGDHVSAMRCIKLAVTNGYDHYNAIKIDLDLKYLRMCEEYRIFADSGFNIDIPK
jgi:hypothetical protein